MEEKKILGFNQNIFFMGLTSFFTDLASEMIQPLLPVFLSSVLGVNKSFIGLIEGVAESTASVLKIFSGYLSDRLGKRKIIVGLGYGLSNLIKPLLAFTTAGWQVLTLRFLDRTGKGLRTSPRDALLADSVPREELGRSFGFHRAMDTAGAVVGPALAFVLMAVLKESFRVIFFLALFPGLLALLGLIFFVKEKAPIQNLQWKLTLKGLNPRFIFFLFIIMLFTLGNSSDAFLILRTQNLGVPIVLIPLVYLMFNMIYTLSAVPGGILSDRIGRKAVIIAGFLIYSLVYFGFALAAQPYLAVLFYAIYGLYYGLADGVYRALVADLVSPDKRGTAYGAYNAAIGITAFPASFIMGILWDTLGASVAFSFGAVLALIAAMLMVFFK